MADEATRNGWRQLEMAQSIQGNGTILRRDLTHTWCRAYFDHTARDSINHQNIPVISSHPFPLQVVISSLNSCVSSPGLSSYYLIICSGQCLVPDRRMDLRTCSAWIWNIILASTADCGGTDRHINRQTKNIQTDRQTDGQTDGWIFVPVGMN